MPTIICPPKNDERYTKLVKSIGEERAALAFFRNGDAVPELEQARAHLANKPRDYIPVTELRARSGPGVEGEPDETTVTPEKPERKVKTMPTGERTIAEGGNGVPRLPSDSAPNLRRLRIFEKTEPAQATGEEAAGPQPIERQAIAENPLVELDKAVGKSGKSESSVAAVIVDNATGEAYVRGAYRGADNTLYIDMASARKGTATGKGSTMTPEADFLGGTQGRPATRLFAEKMTGGLPRYSVWGVGELTRPGGPRNWNAGPASDLASHPALQEAAKRFWTDEARRNRPKAGVEMPKAGTDIEEFANNMVAWRRENAGPTAAKAMAGRVHEHAATAAKGYGLPETKVDAWANELTRQIEERARVQQRQATSISADYTHTTAATVEVMRSTLRALTEDRNVDVAGFQDRLLNAPNDAARRTGFVVTTAQGKKLVAFSMDVLHGPVKADAVVTVLHEAAHIVTDGLAEPLRVSFHEAVEALPWTEKRWLNNPRSLDIRILANADPETLHPEQRSALLKLTPEEVAGARRINPATLAEERMVEHLTQLGWDKSEARGVVQRFFRFVKELWLRLAMTVQAALKGDDHASPELARQYVENRFLQFVHRDSAFARDKINDLRNWLGVPATTRERIPVFPAGITEGDPRLQFIDIATGDLIPVDHGTFTPDAHLAYLQAAIENAQRWVQSHPPGAETPELKFTRRAAFSAPQSLTPSETWNSDLAAINLEDEIYRKIAATDDIVRLLPRTGGGPLAFDVFLDDWLRIPDKQRPEARRSDAVRWASEDKDPLTGNPVAHDPKMTVDRLPSVEEPIKDAEGNIVKLKLSSAQDRAIRNTVMALSETRGRVQSKIARDTQRALELANRAAREKREFAEDLQKEFDRLNEEIPLRQKIAAALKTESDKLVSKFQPGDLVHVYPAAEYLTVPSVDATEAEIRDSTRGVVPRDYKFANKSELAGHLGAMEAWLLNPANREKGQIYGVISEQYRKLMEIPTDLVRAGTAKVLRAAVTGGLADELRLTGLPALRAVAKKFYEASSLVNVHNDDLRALGYKWSEKLADLAQALGEKPSPDFLERFYDPAMRIWESIDVGERGKFNTAGEAGLFARMEDALKAATGLSFEGEAKRGALRRFLMQTIETERKVREIVEQNPQLKVKDDELGVYRRLVTLGLVSGRRTVARHLAGLFMRMNPEWSDTRFIAPEDQRTFWEAAGDLYKNDRKAFDAKMAVLFPDYVVKDFVEPLAHNNVQHFTVADGDNVVRKASVARVRQAWAVANGDVTKFAEQLHAIEGGKPEEASGNVARVLGAFRQMFEAVKRDQDAKSGAQQIGMEIASRQLADARVAQDWPVEWVSYAPYDEKANLILLHQLARQAAFGPDPVAGNAELGATLHQSKRDLAELRYRFDTMYRDGMSLKDIERELGPDDFTIAKNADRITSNLNRVEKAFQQMLSRTNYLAADFRAWSELLGVSATLMLQNPRSGLVNIIGDVQGPLMALKFSRTGLRSMATQGKTIIADFANGVLQAFGQNAAFNIEATQRLAKVGVHDSEAHITWRERTRNLGASQRWAEPAGYESPTAKAARVTIKTATAIRGIIPNIGSPLEERSQLRASPKLRLGFFSTTAQWTLRAAAEAFHTAFSDLAARGVEYLQKIPLVEREQFVRELELGVRDLDAQQLAYHGGLLLNDKAAFDTLRVALETKVPGESGVGRFVAKAYRRMEKANGEPWEAVSNSQFAGIVNYSLTEATLTPNMANLPPLMQGPLRPLFIFITWPYLAMRRFAGSFLDAEGRLKAWGANSTVADGMKAFFMVAAPTTLVGSFAIDWYDKYVQGKKQNLREASLATALPGAGVFEDPAAWLERVGRYGSAGLAGDVINQWVNYDTQRNLSLDDRIVAVNSIRSLFNAAVVNPIQQEGQMTYAATYRPLLQALGAGGALQYLQILNHALDLNTQDAAINARINTGNYLRAAGRQLDLPVRVMSGPSEMPSRASPYLQQMELAALVNNAPLFRDAYRNAVEAARQDGRDNPEKYVADNFTDRHPLRRIFRTPPSEAEYRKMLGAMGEYGAGRVRDAINSFNRYLTNWFGKKPYYGRIDTSGGARSVEELIRRASKINSGMETEAKSLLAIP